MYTNATTLTLTGSLPIKVSGSWMTVWASGVTCSNSGLSASTLYFAYVRDVSGADTCDFSTTGHAPDTASGIETKSGDTTRTLVGQVWVNASGQFESTSYKRNVISWYGRQKLALASWVLSDTTCSTPYATVDDLTVEFVSWAGTALHTSLNAMAVVANAQTPLDLCMSIDGTSTGRCARTISTVNNESRYFATNLPVVVTEGHHTLTVWAYLWWNNPSVLQSGYSHTAFDGLIDG